MHKNRNRLLGTLALLFLFPQLTAVAAEPTYNQEGYGRPTLLILSHPKVKPPEPEVTLNEDDETPPDEIGRRVRAIPGIFTLHKALKAQSIWRIVRGSHAGNRGRPRGVVKVKLYTDRGANKRLLAVISIKYFRDKKGYWQPWYQLDADTVVFWRGNAWGPLNPAADEKNLLFNVTTVSSNGEGYYPYLDLRSTIGAVPIDLWIVGLGYN